MSGPVGTIGVVRMGSAVRIIAGQCKLMKIIDASREGFVITLTIPVTYQKITVKAIAIVFQLIITGR